MDEKIIEQIVKEMFEKAKPNCTSHKKNALSTYLEDYFEQQNNRLSYRTFTRAYEKYIEGKEQSSPSVQSVNFFSNYLGYESYLDYREKNDFQKVKGRPRPIERILKWLKLWSGYKKFLLIGGLILSLGFSVLMVKKDFFLHRNAIEDTTCMVWKSSVYERIPCDSIEIGIQPFDYEKLKYFKKIKVNPAYPFFDEYGNARVWYYKLNKKTVEFFSAPGVHPISGKTLKAVTPYIIEKYVPIHDISKDSFDSLQQ